MLVYNIENSTEYSIICFKDFKSMSYERKLFIIFSWNGTKVLFYYLINWFQKKQNFRIFSQLGNRIFWLFRTVRNGPLFYLHLKLSLPLKRWSVYHKRSYQFSSLCRTTKFKNKSHESQVIILLDDSQPHLHVLDALKALVFLPFCY
jgi:hypothetical protein